MEFSTDPVQPARKTSSPMRRLGISPITRVIAMAVVAMCITGAGPLHSQQDQRAPSQPGGEAATKTAPDGKDQMAMREDQSAKTSIDTAGSEQKREMNDDGMRLLKLATDLKAEVDKSSKDTLSVGVIRKADEIEKLAKSVRDKLKHSMNGN